MKSPHRAKTVCSLVVCKGKENVCKEHARRRPVCIPKGPEACRGVLVQTDTVATRHDLMMPLSTASIRQHATNRARVPA